MASGSSCTGDWLATAMDELCSTVSADEEAVRRDALLWLVMLRSWSPGATEQLGLIAQQLAEGLALARRLDEPLLLLQLFLDVGPGCALPTQGGAARPAGGRSPSFHLVHRPDS